MTTNTMTTKVILKIIIEKTTKKMTTMMMMMTMMTMTTTTTIKMTMTIAIHMVRLITGTKISSAESENKKVQIDDVMTMSPIYMG